MSKQYKLISSAKPSSSTVTESEPVDWKLCILCQSVTQERLQCPANSKRKDVGAGYKYIAENISHFLELGILPLDIKIDQLDDGSGIEATLTTNNAMWHKSCRNKFSNLNLVRAQKRKQEDLSEVICSPVKTRKSDVHHNQTNDSENVCIFCDKTAGSAGLHKASTFELDFKVRNCATKLCDKPLLAKLAAGDMVAIEAEYHVLCLAKLYKHAQQAGKCSTDNDTEMSLHGIAFAELVDYVTACRDSSECTPVFNMADLGRLYSSRLQALGIKSYHVHTTRLKERILAAVPYLNAYNQGRDVLLAFGDDIADTMKEVCEQDFDSEALILAKAAKVIRRDVLKLKNSFNGRFSSRCQEESVPPSLLALVHMMLDGPSGDEKSLLEPQQTAANITIAQLIAFNLVKSRCRDSQSSI